MTFWVYMLHCRGGYFYTGHTDDLERRIGQHESGHIPGFVDDHWPAKLVWSQEFPTRIEALETERRIKGWSRAKKMALIRGDWNEVSRLAKGKGSPSTSSGRTEFTKSLIVHPETAPTTTLDLDCTVSRSPSELRLEYHLTGPTHGVFFSGNTDRGRTEQLWQTTCFELFIASSETGYYEFNFAPDGAWAFYAFTDYRTGMTSSESGKSPLIMLSKSEDCVVLTVAIDVASLPAILQDQEWHLNLTAVIEEIDGTKSYWALKHPEGPPDFHDPACFVLELGAPGEA